MDFTRGASRNGGKIPVLRHFRATVREGAEKGPFRRYRFAVANPSATAGHNQRGLTPPASPPCANLPAYGRGLPAASTVHARGHTCRRNAGGRASDDAIRSLVISHKLLGTR